MPLVAFSTLPDDARVWVFGSADEISQDAEATLVTGIDEYLGDWRAHGSPLTVARDWRDRRFLAVAVDQRDENASGCSLDALFRVLQSIEARIGTSLLGNARVYYRDRAGSIRVTDRAGFAEGAQNGSIGADSRVFDLSIQTVGDWKRRFETTASTSWHQALLPVAV
ncbi:MAG: hypothetical protein ACHQQP_04930 [Gemmatimonadales bacterium]